MNQDAEIIKFKLNQQQKQLKWAIETKFAKALSLKESLKIYIYVIEQNKSYADLANKKKQAGLASDADLIEFDLNETLLRSDLEEIKIDYQEALNDLQTSLGNGTSDKIEVNGELAHYHLRETYKDLQEKVKNSNMVFKVTDLELKRAEQLRLSSYGGFLPEVTLRATYGRRGLEDPVGPEQGLALIARWELFSGFKNKAEHELALTIQEKASFERNQIQVQLPRKLETEFLKFSALQNRVDLESQNRERSKRYLNTVMSEYRRGVKNSADLKSALTQLLESSLRDLKYRYEGIRQKEVLQSLLGEDLNFEIYSTEHKVN